MYHSEDTLKAIFDNPRSCTEKGYRSADKAKRGYVKYGIFSSLLNFASNSFLIMYDDLAERGDRIKYSILQEFTQTNDVDQQTKLEVDVESVV